MALMAANYDGTGEEVRCSIKENNTAFVLATTTLFGETNISLKGPN